MSDGTVPRSILGSRRFVTDSLGARFELPGAIILARKVPIEAATKLSDEFDKWVRKPMTEVFQDSDGRPALFPTKIGDIVKPMTIGVAGE